MVLTCSYILIMAQVIELLRQFHQYFFESVDYFLASLISKMSSQISDVVIFLYEAETDKKTAGIAN